MATERMVNEARQDVRGARRRSHKADQEGENQQDSVVPSLLAELERCPSPSASRLTREW